MQYTQDYDEKYPFGTAFPGFGSTWAKDVQPYMKSTQVFICPSDTAGGVPLPAGAGWAGVGLSYAANGNFNFSTDANGSTSFGFLGVFGVYDTGNAAKGQPRAVADISQAATSIMVAEKHNSDALAGSFFPNGGVGNASAWGPNGVIGGRGYGFNGWGQSNIPNDQASGTGYNNDVNGAVSVKHLETANFLFVDGHVKALRPLATNPGGNGFSSANRQANMWDVVRP